MYVVEAGGIERVVPLGSDMSNTDQAGGAERTQMLGHSRL